MEVARAKMHKFVDNFHKKQLVHPMEERENLGFVPEEDERSTLTDNRMWMNPLKTMQDQTFSREITRFLKTNTVTGLSDSAAKKLACFLSSNNVQFQAQTEANDTAKNPLDTLDRNSCAPIHYAAKYNNVQVVSFLIENKVDVNAPGSQGFSPIHIAAR